MPTQTRREFTRLALSALPAASLLTALRAEAAEKPNSRFAGVHIGLNVPYSFGNMAMTADQILQSCVQLGFSGVELRTQPVEALLGAPIVMGKPDPAAIRPWREAAQPGKAEAIRKQWGDAGVLIEIVKVDGLFKMSDGELDYVFRLAKTLGARSISTEISKSDEEHRRIGQFADKHRMLVGLHGHATTSPADWERAFALAQHLGANVDLGHFVAGDHGSPVPFIEKHHARVTHVHLKDRKKGNGPNFPFGQGDTPIKEVLHLIRDHKWPIQATVEFEYRVPQGSDRMTELGRTLAYCREALS